jgi:hypothetical protein
MRTTLVLDDRIVTEAKRYARREGTSLTAVIDAALRQFLASQRKPKTAFRLELQIRSSRVLPGVDIEDRDSLYDLMEGRR